MMTAAKTKTACERCGTCCMKGGPALHDADILLLRNRWLAPEQLITIRKGEPVFAPNVRLPAPAQSEIVKIRGRGSDWICLFFRPADVACGIYHHRPLECSLLKCWDTADLEKAAGRNLLSRRDIIGPHDPVLQFIETHERECSLAGLTLLLSSLAGEDSRQQAMAGLTSLVNRDLAIRTRAWTTMHFSLELELFYFGRPLFKILQQFGLEMQETNDGGRLSFAYCR